MTSKIESHAQVDTTLILSLNALLTEGISDRIADVTNLMTFAHAVILFDKVMIPFLDKTRPAMENLPSSIVNEGIFKDAVDEDFQQRMKDCIDQSFIMGSASKSLPSQSDQSPTLVLSKVRQILSDENKAWPRAFNKHIHHLMEAHSEAVLRELTKIMNDYSIDPAYLSLPIEKKTELIYLWRCHYNVSLSIEKQWPYLHNAYRLPFVNAIYHDIEEQRLALPLAEKLPSGLEGANSQPTVYNFLLPSLLGSILSNVNKKEQIISEVLAVRESRQARDFRSHYRELQEKLGEPGASLKLEKDMKHLRDLWAGFDDPVPIPVRITHYDWGGIEIQPYVPASAVSPVKRLYARLSKRHLRFGIHLLEHPEYYMELNHLVHKTFGSKHRRSQIQKKYKDSK